MKILFVTAGYLPRNIGGVELHVHHLAREFRRQGHEVLVFSREYAPARPEYDVVRSSYEEVPVMRMNYKFSDCDTFEKIYSNPEIVRGFRNIVREYRPDVVHVHHLSGLTTDLVLFLKEEGVPVVMTLHDFWMGCPRGQRLTAALTPCPEIHLERCLPCLRELWPAYFESGRGGMPDPEANARDLALLENYHAHVQHVLSAADRLVTPSRFMKEMYVRYGVKEGTVTVVENGLDHDLFKGTKRTRSSIVRFGYLGSILPSKGIHILIEAFKLIGGSDCSLTIHGEVLPFHKDTNYGHRLAVLTQGWESSIHFHGRYENRDVPRLLATMDVLVVPSIWYEAFCLTLREAFLAGVPVIASNYGAMAEAVENGETGLLFNVGDCVDLSEKMRRLVADPDLRRKLADSPKKVLTLQENATALKRVYGEVTGRAFD